MLINIDKSVNLCSLYTAAVIRSTDTDRKHSFSSSKVLGTLPHESTLYYAARNSLTHIANSYWIQLPYKIHKLQPSYKTSGIEQRPEEYSS